MAENGSVIMNVRNDGAVPARITHASLSVGGKALSGRLENLVEANAVKAVEFTPDEPMTPGDAHLMLTYQARPSGVSLRLAAAFEWQGEGFVLISEHTQDASIRPGPRPLRRSR